MMLAFFLKKTLIQASIYQNEGQLQAFGFQNNSWGCLRCMWPQVPNPGCVGTCVDVGVLGFVPGVLGTMQAAEAIKYLLDWDIPSLSHTLLVNLMNWDIYSVKRTKKKDCFLCGENPKLRELSKIHYGQTDYDIDLSQIPDQELGAYEFIDIRKACERNLDLPWEFFLKHQPCEEGEEFQLSPSSKPIVLVCQKGIRSRTLAEHLRRGGETKIYSLKQGISSVREHWDRIQSLRC